MASASNAQKRSGNGRRLIYIIGGVLVLVALCVGGFYFLSPKPPVAGTIPDGWQVVDSETGTIASTVSATGNIEPLAEANLRFETTGTITEVLVKPGDVVEAGQALARVDTGGLSLQLEQAQAELNQAQADYEELLAGADANAVAEAQARLQQARNQYQQTASSVSSADINAARSDLERAQAALAKLESGPENAELAAENQAVQSAQSTLDQSKTDLAAAKERARLDVETKANALRNAQDAYSTIYWQNRELESLPGDLPQDVIDQETQAQRAVTDAEAALSTAQTAYEQAKQDEINKIRANEAALASAIASRDKLLDGADASELASARAEVQRAQAALTKLIGSSRASDLAASQSSIDIAQASLDTLLADPSNATLVTNQTAIIRAEISVKQAERNLALATLTAPFAATIGSVDMQIGEQADTTSIVALVDLSSFHIDLPIDELDIAQVTPGLSAAINIDALPDADIGGEVTQIAPQATRSDQGTTTYEVTVQLDADSEGVRPGMTAVVEIITLEKADVVLVPRRAVRTENGQSYVMIYDPNGTPVQVIEGGFPSFQPAHTRRDVTIGLSNNEVVEIASGLEAGESVLIQSATATLNPAGGPP